MQCTNRQAFLWPRSNWTIPWLRQREHIWSFLTSQLLLKRLKALWGSSICDDFSSSDLLRTKFNFNPFLQLSGSLRLLISYLCIAISFAIKLCRSRVTRHLAQSQSLKVQCFLWPFKITCMPWFRQRAQTWKFLTPLIATTSSFYDRRNEINTKLSMNKIKLYISELRNDKSTVIMTREAASATWDRAV